MNKQLKQLNEIWPKIPNWAKEDILKIATISTKEEQWKLVVPPEGKFGDAIKGKYLVSNLGRLRNISTDKIVTQYNCVLAKRSVHRLVAATWLKQKPKGHVVMHMDDDGTNNWIGNLKYGTRKENAQKTQTLKI